MLVTVAADDGTRHRCRPPAEARSPGASVPSETRMGTARGKPKPDVAIEVMARDLARHMPVVGDRVTFVVPPGGEGRVTAIAPRARVVSRCLEHGVRPMAAHIDRLVLVSAVEPAPKAGLIDRFAVTADPDVEIHLVLNKCDLGGAPCEAAEAALADLVASGMKLHRVATRGDVPEASEGLASLRAALSSGTTLFAGHSGVGKSSLLNALVPDLALATGDVNDFTRKGRHTTTVATLHRLGPEACLIDTPGVRAWSLDGVPLHRVAARFPGLEEVAAGCHLPECLHDGEPGCAVAEAVADGSVPQARHARYLQLKAALVAERASSHAPGRHDARVRGRHPGAARRGAQPDDGA